MDFIQYEVIIISVWKEWFQMSVLIKNVCLNYWKQFIRESGTIFFAHFVLSESHDKVGSCSNISEVSMVVLTVSFWRPDNI